MPRRRTVTGPPRSYVLAGTWPTGKITNPDAALAQKLASNLAEAIGEQSVREVARLTELDRSSISGLLRGETWGDVLMVGRLERTLGARLWPDVDGV